MYNVKNKIDEKIGMDVQSQILSCNGNILEDEENMMEKINFISDTPVQLIIRGIQEPKKKRRKWCSII